MTGKQVEHSYYAKEKYASVERFISYREQIQAVRTTDAQKILFVGVGDGVVPHYLKSVLGLDVTTLDIDPDLRPDVVGDVKKLPFADDTFDVVAVFEVLEHLPFDFFKDVLRELNRVSKKEVLISLPYRHTGIDMVVKFPFVRTLLKKNWLRLRLSIPIRFPGFEVSGQHYWEIDNGKTSKGRVLEVIRRVFDVADTHHTILDAYRYFLRLSKKNAVYTQNQYVETYYNEYLSTLDGAYEDARWHASSDREFDYLQTQKVILAVLEGQEKGRVLEIGPGDGVWTRLLIPYVRDLTLVEQSEEMLTRAKQRLKDVKNITYFHGDFSDFRTSTEQDLIFASRCFEYFNDKDDSLKQMRGILRQGGKVVIITKNANFISRSKKKLHSKQVGKEEMVSLLRKNGFEVQHVYAATVRVKAKHAIMRMLFSFLHTLHVKTSGVFTIPKLFDLVTESYIYVAKKK